MLHLRYSPGGRKEPNALARDVSLNDFSAPCPGRR